MRKAGREFGDGYFNAVLIDLLKDSDLISNPKIAEILRHIGASLPCREGTGAKSYNLCREMIEDAIRGRAQELTGPLKYSQDEAKHILLAVPRGTWINGSQSAPAAASAGFEPR